MAEAQKQIKREEETVQYKVAVRILQYKSTRTLGFKHSIPQFQFKEVSPSG